MVGTRWRRKRDGRVAMRVDAVREDALTGCVVHLSSAGGDCGATVTGDLFVRGWEPV